MNSKQTEEIKCSHDDLGRLISMVCDQFEAGFADRNEFVDKTITHWKESLSLPAKPVSGAYVSAKTSWPNKRGSFVIRYQDGRTDSWFIDQPNDVVKETWFKAANSWLFEWWDENAIVEAPAKPVSEVRATGAEKLNESAQEACMLIIGAYEGYSWEGGDLQRTASDMFEYAKAGYEVSKAKPVSEDVENKRTFFEWVNNNRLFFVDEVRSWLKMVDSGDISFSKFVELFNEKVFKSGYDAAPAKGMKWVKGCPNTANYIPCKIDGVYELLRFEGCDDGTGGIIWSCFDRDGNRMDTDENKLLIEYLDESPSDSEAGAVDYKAKYEKCITIIKRFDAGIIGLYDL